MITAEEERALRATVRNLMQAQSATAENVTALLRLVAKMEDRIAALERPRPHVLMMPPGLTLPTTEH